MNGAVPAPAATARVAAGAAADLPPAAFALALASLPGCFHARLRAVLAGAGGDPRRAWEVVRAQGTLDLDVGSRVADEVQKLRTKWATAGGRWDVGARWAATEAAGIGVWVLGDADYPPRLAADPDPAPVLFHRGHAEALPPPTPAVAIVGTRRCTAYGTDVARQLGRDLAAAGVTVVSGLALGIDGAAHEGALAGATSSAGGAAPVGVVGSGLDVVYPPRHRRLWDRVADAGILLSEAPPGAAPEPWRFPRRNRLLAALADVVVVVESHRTGGSLSTVRQAVDRGRLVMAVPGSVRSPSSAGTNRLLADGVAPVTDATDVLVALALEGAHVGPPASRGEVTSDACAAEADPLLDAVDWTPTPTEDVLRRTGLTVEEAATALTRLEVQGLVRRRPGGWERAVPPGPATDGGYTATT
jgi:DNA processing protein